MWENSVFGGSVLNAIRRAKTGIGGSICMAPHNGRKSFSGKEVKSNTLKHKIEGMS